MIHDCLQNNLKHAWFTVARSRRKYYYKITNSIKTRLTKQGYVDKIIS